MEESEKRKERLKAMRMEAAHAEVSNNVETSAMPGCLSNPLNETSTTATGQHDFCGTPRFDYYTDPMAAFSSKKRVKGDNQTMQESLTSPTASGWPMAMPLASPPDLAGPRNLPVNKTQSQFSLDQSVQQGTSPPSMHPGNPHAWNATANYHKFATDGSPRGMLGAPGMYPGTSPRVWNPSNASRYGKLPSPGFLPSDGPSLRVRPQLFGNNPIFDPGSGHSPGLNSGRGRSYGYSASMSAGLGRSEWRGRGRGFHGRSPASNRTLGPECFFDESMLEDPWQHLQPIPWKRQEAGTDNLSTSGSSNSWLPKSISTQKAKLSEASNRFNSQTSLAEYLAASFNKATEDTENA